MLITNVANNAITGAVLMQIIAVAAPSLDLAPTPLAMTVTMGMFVALLTPAASPYAAVLHASRDRISTSEILCYGLAVMAISIICYLIIGLPIANILF